MDRDRQSIISWLHYGTFLAILTATSRIASYLSFAASACHLAVKPDALCAARPLGVLCSKISLGTGTSPGSCCTVGKTMS